MEPIRALLWDLEWEPQSQVSWAADLQVENNTVTDRCGSFYTNPTFIKMFILWEYAVGAALEKAKRQKKNVYIMFIIIYEIKILFILQCYYLITFNYI